jgi:hypothetical protein
MIGFTVDPDWYRKYWYGGSVAAGDEDHCAILMRGAKFAAAWTKRAMAAVLGAVRGAVARRRMGECA